MSFTSKAVFGCWLLVASLGLTGQTESQTKPAEPKAPVPVEQPLPFSHKQHSKLGFKCQQCHAGTEEHMGYPATAKCMACHTAYLKDSPNIKKLAQYAESKEIVPWRRVYRLPDYVFFSHAIHLSANAKCEECHGAVADQDVLAKPVGRFMQGCMGCHQKHNASVDCSTCHEAAR